MPAVPASVMAQYLPCLPNRRQCHYMTIIMVVNHSQVTVLRPRYSVALRFFNIMLISFDGDVVDEFQQSLATHIVVSTDKEVVDVDFC